MRQFISRNRKAKRPKIDKLWFYRKTTFRTTGTKYFNAVFSINKPSRKQKYAVTHDYYLLNQPQIKGIGAHHISSTMWVNLCWLEGKKKSKIRGVNNWSVFVICSFVIVVDTRRMLKYLWVKRNTNNRPQSVITHKIPMNKGGFLISKTNIIKKDWAMVVDILYWYYLSMYLP